MDNAAIMQAQPYRVILSASCQDFGSVMSEADDTTLISFPSWQGYFGKEDVADT
jgi:hypothetical protein